jgi:hypothetical protein
MKRLPLWNIPPTSPALFDIHSATVLEQTARMYDAMNQLIDEWGNMMKSIADFEKSEMESREEFEMQITKVIREFMCSWNQKTEDLEQFATTIINEAITAGKITITEVYDPETESLNMVVGGEA